MPRALTVSTAIFRRDLSDLLGRVQHGGECITITRHGKPAAVLVPVAASGREPPPMAEPGEGAPGP